MAAALEGPTLVRKGPQDGISNGKRTIYCTAAGSKRRAGGQVDTSTLSEIKSPLPRIAVIATHRDGRFSSLHFRSLSSR
jgi:hypothetical protein